jgi:hypothetical protein
MKPHEETWRAHDCVVELDPRAPGDPGQVADFEAAAYADTHDSIVARAKLAAQAPAMARLLLKHQWGGLDECSYSICPECGGNQPFADTKFERPPGHAPNCKLVKALRDAGVSLPGACCERDTDGDGNCDRHPAKKG